MKYTASIVIPTMFSNLDYLKDCLISLSKLSFKENFEVLVVCNSDKQTMMDKQKQLYKVFGLFQKNKELKWICMGSNTGFVGATNRGIKESLGEYVIFLNDDTQVEPDWLDELVITQQNTGADMVASKVYLGDRKTLDSHGFGFSWRGKAEALDKNLKCSLCSNKDYWLNHPEFLPQTNLEEPFGPDGAAALYTKNLFNKIGLLEKDFFAYLEDVDLALRARQNEMFCALADKAIVYHYKHATSSKFSSFKSRQDLINWWKIVIRRYNPLVWFKYGFLILTERGRNLSGYFKSLQ